MKHSKIVPLIVLNRKVFSIIEITELIIDFYKKLSENNIYYKLIYIISEKKPLNQIIDVQDINSVHLLSEEILHQNIDDIRKVDGIDNPDVNYRRDEKGGIGLGLGTKVEEETFITLNYSFYLNRSTIGSIVVNELCFDSFLKAKMFLEIANNVFSVNYSVMKIMDISLNEIARGYFFPLGWITYFSNSHQDTIPDDLDGFIDEFTDNGKYIILSKEDFISDPKKLEPSIKKLILCLKHIENKSPSYSKNGIPPSSNQTIN